MHVKSMKNIDWEEAAKNVSVPVSPYMETLTKETGTLQKVLAKHLPEPVVAGIMIPVFASYREQWTNAYRDVTIKSGAAKDRLLADAEFFRSQINKIDGSGDIGEHIVKVVQTKPILNAVVPPPPASEAPAASKVVDEKREPTEQNGTKDEADLEKKEEVKV